MANELKNTLHFGGKSNIKCQKLEIKPKIIFDWTYGNRHPCALTCAVISFPVVGSNFGWKTRQKRKDYELQIEQLNRQREIFTWKWQMYASYQKSHVRRVFHFLCFLFFFFKSQICFAVLWIACIIFFKPTCSFLEWS